METYITALDNFRSVNLLFVNLQLTEIPTECVTLDSNKVGDQAGCRCGLLTNHGSHPHWKSRTKENMSRES